MEPFVRRNDCHVRGDEAVVSVQRRDRGLQLTVSPQREIRHLPRRDNGRVEDVGLRAARRSTGTADDVDRLLAHERLAVVVACIQHAAGRDGIQREAAGSRGGEVAVDVDDEIGQL